MLRAQLQQPTLRFSLSVLFTGLVVCTALVLGSATYFSAQQFVREGLRARLRDTVNVGSTLIDVEAHQRLRVASDEQSPDYQEIRKTLQTIRSRCEGVRYVYTMRLQEDGTFKFVVDAEQNPEEVSHLGDVFDGEVSEAMRAAFAAGSGPQVEESFSTDNFGVWLSCYAPLVTADGKVDGVLGMDTAADSVIAYERASLITIPVITLLIGLLAALFGAWLAKRMTKPLMQLAADMEAVQQFRLAPGLQPRTRIREIVKMHAALENMKGGLRSFSRYVPVKLVASLIRLGKEAKLGSERTEITLFFSDIRDFTSVSEKLSAEDLSANLSVYFRGMTTAIVDQRGTVDKFIGDAIMAFWGAPEPLADHPDAACRAALHARRFLVQQCAEWRRVGLPPLETGMGIHTGIAMVGNVGFDERLDYTAMGDAVNLASRIEGLNKVYGTHILISESTLSRVGDRFGARWIDRIVVKGKGTAIDVYELLGEAAELSEADRTIIMLSIEARDLYLARQFEAAAGMWQAVLTIQPANPAATLLRERALAFIASPPPPDWSGAYKLQHK
ncbi:MAG: hypothetical protein K8T90_16915 [Planctomycetes bacterium]|nr:hypothetical protein [Planctomycetota bacterium]